MVLRSRHRKEVGVGGALVTQERNQHNNHVSKTVM